MEAVGERRRVTVPRFRNGLDLPITGSPDPRITEAPEVDAVAVIAADHVGFKAKIAVAEGDKVRLGQPVLYDKRVDGVAITAPAAGVVRAIHRGARRVLESVVIDRDDGVGDERFPTIARDHIASVDRGDIVDTLARSGLWAALRTRPFSKIPDPRTTPQAVFVTAMESAPLAPDAALIIGQAPQAFEVGVRVLARLTDGSTYVCQRAGAALPEIDAERVVHAEFDGPHPAGLAGTHVHVLHPVDANREVWTIGYQDAIAIGHLFTTGRLSVERVVALCGPAARDPRHLRTRPGAAIAPLIAGETSVSPVRPISGDVLTGRAARDQFAYLDRFARQITLMHDAAPRELLGWVLPGVNKFATARVHLRHLMGRIKVPLPLNTNINGSARAMVPVGLYEDVIPMDMLATQLLRAILVLDTDMAQALGVLELDEEDLALCTYICHSKYEYGMALRSCLDKIEAEG